MMTIKEFEIQNALGSLPYCIKYKLAYNPNTSKKILNILSTDEDYSVQYYVANNPNTLKKEQKRRYVMANKKPKGTGKGGSGRRNKTFPDGSSTKKGNEHKKGGKKKGKKKK